MERLNGETIVGVTLVFLALIFIFAATQNEVWALILPGTYLILAIGFAFIALGVVTLVRNRKYAPEEEESTHHHH
jgi:uncharacterized membrane protein